MRTTLRNGATVSCDIDKCNHPAFITYSMVSMARPQATDAGWGRVKLNMLENWTNLQMGSDGRRKLDVCPPHRQEIWTVHAARRARSSEEKAKERTAAKAAKLAEKVAAKQKAKQDRQDAKAAAKAAARATKKQRSKKGATA